MDFGFLNERVYVLGQEYAIQVKKPGEDDGFRNGHMGANGFISPHEKIIVLADKSKPDWTDKEKRFFREHLRKTLRHEIIHAFLAESGLGNNTYAPGGWAKNEEMVDWFAMQGPKIVKAWRDAGALELPCGKCLTTIDPEIVNIPDEEYAGISVETENE